MPAFDSAEAHISRCAQSKTNKAGDKINLVGFVRTTSSSNSCRTARARWSSALADRGPPGQRRHGARKDPLARRAGEGLRPSGRHHRGMARVSPCSGRTAARNELAQELQPLGDELFLNARKATRCCQVPWAGVY
jgi:hypothetical protein